MRCSLFFVTIIFLTACEKMPPLPSGDLCTIDLPREQLICCPIAKAESEKQLYEGDQCHNVALADADKYIAFSPKTWENVVIYIKTLKMAAEQCLNSLATPK
jgi:hypothetical protein